MVIFASLRIFLFPYASVMFSIFMEKVWLLMPT